MNFRVLVLKNPLSPNVNITDDIKKWVNYENKNTPLTLVVDVVDVDIKNLKHKEFATVRTGIDDNGNDILKTVYGLDGIKERVRKLDIVPLYIYHAVVFVYDLAGTNHAEGETVGHWTYWKELSEGTEFIEVATKPSWDKVDDTFRVLTHEIRHAYTNRARRKGYAVRDVMDETPKQVDCETKEIAESGKCSKLFPYYKEFEPLAEDGNRAVSNSVLNPFWGVIVSQPQIPRYIKFLQELVKKLLALIYSKKMKNNNLIKRWAEAIQKHEGFYVGSRSYRNNNPANMRYTNYTATLGAIGQDKNNFSIFKDYQSGFDALVQFLTDAHNGLLVPYRGNPTLLRFFEVYAPSSDNNDPLRYAEVVAKYIGSGVTIYTKIADIQNSEKIQVKYGVKKGDRSEVVEDLQKALILLGYEIPAGATGFYGTQTQNAVLGFHKDNWAKIFEINNFWTKEELEKLAGINFGKLSVQVINNML